MTDTPSNPWREAILDRLKAVGKYNDGDQLNAEEALSKLMTLLSMKLTKEHLKLGEDDENQEFPAGYLHLNAAEDVRIEGLLAQPPDDPSTRFPALQLSIAPHDASSTLVVIFGDKKMHAQLLGAINTISLLKAYPELGSEPKFAFEDNTPDFASTFRRVLEAMATRAKSEASDSDS